MTEHTTVHGARYLMVEISGQVFAVAASDVVAVQRMNELQPVPAGHTEAAARDYIAAIDLRRLFWGTALSEHRTYAVVLSAQAGTCAVLVDTVQPSRIIDPNDWHPLPPLLTQMGCPFSGVVRTAEDLALILDTQRLIVQIHRAAPELVTEKTYAI
jgi:chemotaxis signal transduction protein